MRSEIHARAGLFGFSDLIQVVTGKPFDGSDFEDYLVQRYLT